METLLLVPGLLSDADLFAEQVADLADVADVRVTDVATGGSIAEMAAEALRVAPDRFALGGLSMGGYVVWEVLRQAPERVTRLALLDTSARPESPAQTARRHALLRQADVEGLPAALADLWPVEVAPSRVGDQVLRDRFAAMGARQGVEVFRRQQEAIMARADSRPDLPGVEVPTLVLCGRDDAITPLDGHEEIAAGVRGAELVVLDDCGHLSSWERPGEVSAALRSWLAR